ncbi:MAG: AraC family transcriptional regulator [Bacteroidetes bacterium]|nr:AraC family transcriptional regulator [Bacteroidota bacterium]
MKLDTIHNIIEQFYHDCKFNVDALSMLTGYSRGYVWEQIKSTSDTTLGELLERKRIEKSLELISKNICLCTVHSKAGFTNAKSFRRAFKKRLGVTPTYYKKLLSDNTKSEEAERIRNKL